MIIEIASHSLEILGRQGRVLKLDFAAPLDEVSLRRQRKTLRAAGRSTKHERDLQLDTLSTEDILKPFFATDTHVLPVRVLSGLTITMIIARKAPHELGDFGFDVYARVLRDLQNSGRLRTPIADFAGLEELFADKVAAVIHPMALDWRRRHKLDDIDETFYTITTGRALVSVDSSSDISTGDPVVSVECPIKVRLSALEQRIEEIGGVFANLRSAPNLSAVTIKGIASAPSVLDATNVLSLDYLEVAKEASAYRRSMKLGGRSVGAESVAFYVRVFRAMGLTSVDAAAFSAETLKALVQRAIDTHLVDSELQAVAA